MTGVQSVENLLSFLLASETEREKQRQPISQEGQGSYQCLIVFCRIYMSQDKAMPKLNKFEGAMLGNGNVSLGDTWGRLHIAIDILGSGTPA